MPEAAASETEEAIESSDRLEKEVVTHLQAAQTILTEEIGRLRVQQLLLEQSTLREDLEQLGHLVKVAELQESLREFESEVRTKVEGLGERIAKVQEQNLLLGQAFERLVGGALRTSRGKYRACLEVAVELRERLGDEEAYLELVTQKLSSALRG